MNTAFETTWESSQAALPPVESSIEKLIASNEALANR